MLQRTTLSAILSAALLCGCGQSTAAPDGRALAAVETVTPGDRCPAGGQKILTGVDVNGDGVLQANEVTQIAYVCNGQSAATCTTLEGSITIRNSFDWANLVQAGCQRITGTLEIFAQGATSLGAPSPLVEVGALQVHGNDLLTALDFPALTTVNGDLDLSGNAALTSFNHAFPALAAVHGAIIADDNASLVDADLPALATVEGGIWFHLLPLPGNLSFPALTTVRNGITLDSMAVPGTLSLPLVTDLTASVGGELHLYGAQVAHLDLPRLVAGDFNFMNFDTLQELVLPALTGPSNFFFQGLSIPRLSAPGLVSGGVFLRDGDFQSIELPAFTVGSLSLEMLLGPTDVTLPSFQEGYIAVSDNYSLKRFSAPLLAKSTLNIHGNQALAVLDLPALTAPILPSGTVEGPPMQTIFVVQNNPALPQCQVDAILARIVPPPDRVLMDGNDTTATCQ
jgi:hypothetical protein